MIRHTNFNDYTEYGIIKQLEKFVESHPNIISHTIYLNKPHDYYCCDIIYNDTPMNETNLSNID